MLQNLIVFAIVAAAAVYAVWRWMPAAWRRGAARRLAAGSQRAGLVDDAQAERLAASLAKTSGCGDCESCGSCAPPSAGAKRPE
ncbi:DUF6587 family protein [Pseudorhodoferax sp.]|uniref:DUF6587 family protein n=1 Tax=Pseudorhodoferax sp. TaxID=1993553 RepID=UPI0039E32537